MDNITHGLAGMLMADVTVQAVAQRSARAVSPRFRRAAVLLGIVAAEFPDTDLVYSGPLVNMGPLGYLLHHRGHTHTLVWASVSAVLLWLVTRWWVRRGDGVDRATSGGALLALAFAGTWSHLLLDWTNSYGVHPFWPLDNRWFYGDAVFIVEPWLWLVAIPPLLWGARTTGGRTVLGLLGVGILAASWFTGQVARDVAVVLTVFTLLWLGAQWLLRDRLRAWGGVALWATVTSGFTITSRAVRAEATRALTAQGDVVRDVVLNPAPANPTCWTMLVVSTRANGAEYRLTSGVAAPFATLPATRCGAADSNDRRGSDVLAGLSNATAAAPTSGSTRMRWQHVWAVPTDSLRALATAHCEVAAALRFMRTPVWERRADGRLALADARYGTSGGFNALELPAPSSICTLTGKWIPPWTPPRADVL
jgi:inner membrane protein